jgi:VanZ family protein
MRRVWFLAVAVVIVGSLLPGGSPALHAIALLHISDKLQHFLAYMALAWFPAWLDSRSAAAAACGKLVTMGVALELLQTLVPGRSCELRDALADLGGVLCGALVALVSRALISGVGLWPAHSAKAS